MQKYISQNLCLELPLHILAISCLFVLILFIVFCSMNLGIFAGLMVLFSSLRMFHSVTELTKITEFPKYTLLYAFWSFIYCCVIFKSCILRNLFLLFDYYSEKRNIYFPCNSMSFGTKLRPKHYKQNNICKHTVVLKGQIFINSSFNSIMSSQ